MLLASREHALCKLQTTRVHAKTKDAVHNKSMAWRLVWIAINKRQKGLLKVCARSFSMLTNTCRAMYVNIGHAVMYASECLRG
jgi:hypothetical protein